MKKNKQEIQDFIQKNCSKLNKKITENIDFDLQGKIKMMIYRANSSSKDVTVVP